MPTVVIKQSIKVHEPLVVHEYWLFVQTLIVKKSHIFNEGNGISTRRASDCGKVLLIPH